MSKLSEPSEGRAWRHCPAGILPICDMVEKDCQECIKEEREWRKSWEN